MFSEATKPKTQLDKIRSVSVMFPGEFAANEDEGAHDGHGEDEVRQAVQAGRDLLSVSITPETESYLNRKLSRLKLIILTL